MDYAGSVGAVMMWCLSFQATGHSLTQCKCKCMVGQRTDETMSVHLTENCTTQVLQVVLMRKFGALKFWIPWELLPTGWKITSTCRNVSPAWLCLDFWVPNGAEHGAIAKLRQLNCNLRCASTSQHHSPAEDPTNGNKT